MLVIRRRCGESILIGDDIEVQIAEIGPTRVKLAIAAPKQVQVLRKEVKLTREENQTAARELDLASVHRLVANFGPERQILGGRQELGPPPANSLAPTSR